MQELIFNAVSQMVDGKTFLILVGIFLVYRRVGVVECGVRAGLLSHITRIHSNAVTHGDGTISKSTLAIVEECNRQYVALGGDGLAAKCMDEIRLLKVRS